MNLEMSPTILPMYANAHIIDNKLMTDIVLTEESVITVKTKMMNQR